MSGTERAWRVVWSGSSTQRDLAHLLADGAVVRAGPDIAKTLIDTKATLHVTTTIQPLTPASVAVPHKLNLGAVDEVVAAVGGGPHSELAATLARRAAEKLGVPGLTVTGYRRPEHRRAAEDTLTELAARGIDMPMDAVRAESPAELVDSLSPNAMLVIGASGGSWFHRQFFGPGVRLRVAAPCGVVVVRQDGLRVYQVMSTPAVVGSHMRIRNVLEVSPHPVVLVADQGRLIGTLHRHRLASLPPHVEVGTVVDTPVAVNADEPVDQIGLVLEEHLGGPVGVVDRRGQLVGSVSVPDLAAAGQANRKEAS